MEEYYMRSMHIRDVVNAMKTISGRPILLFLPGVMGSLMPIRGVDLARHFAGNY